MHTKFTCYLLLLLLIMISCSSDSKKSDSLPRSYLQGNIVHIIPQKFVFKIPDEWISWEKEFHNNIHLPYGDLNQVKDGSGEWDTEYAKIVNATLPFDNCAAHLGGEGWGEKGVSFGDLQSRIYILASPKDEIKRRIQEQGLNAAKLISSDAKLVQKMDNSWEISHIEYGVFYYDYGGTAQIDFYIRYYVKSDIIARCLNMKKLERTRNNF